MKIFKGTLVFLFLAFWTAASGFAGEAQLNWQPNSESDLGGYKVYYGTQSRIYGPPVNVGNVTAYKLINLPDVLHYFAVTAYDTSGNESGYSAEVSKNTALMPPTNFRYEKVFSVQFKWDAVPGASKYRLYYALSTASYFAAYHEYTGVSSAGYNAAMCATMKFAVKSVFLVNGQLKESGFSSTIDKP